MLETRARREERKKESNSRVKERRCSKEGSKQPKRKERRFRASRALTARVSTLSLLSKEAHSFSAHARAKPTLSPPSFSPSATPPCGCIQINFTQPSVFGLSSLPSDTISSAISTVYHLPFWPTSSLTDAHHQVFSLATETALLSNLFSNAGRHLRRLLRN